jgi:segregation and condensation protein A
MGKTIDKLASSLEEPVHLAAFEGPLDLLLFLVRQSELDIYDIPIAEIARQYMQIIERAREERLDMAGDFFVMAATLMRIKSRMLLPPETRPDETQQNDADDPRWELAKMLLEYNRFKEAAGELALRINAASDLMPRDVGEEPAGAQQGKWQPVDRFDVWNAYNVLMRRLAARLGEVGIEPERMSVSDCMETIRARMLDEGKILFTDLFPAKGQWSLLVVAMTFLAMLELTRLGAVKITQTAAFDDILIEGTRAGASLSN